MSLEITEGGGGGKVSGEPLDEWSRPMSMSSVSPSNWRCTRIVGRAQR